MTLYKATDPEGRSFSHSDVTWKVSEVTHHPTSKRMKANDASTYLSASSEPADCTGFGWPCRLFEVEAVGKTLTGMDHSSKVAALAFRVVRELPAWQAFGPNGEAVVAFIERCRRLTPDEIKRWDAAVRVAARDAARDAAWDAAWVAARDTARVAAWVAARVAARVAAVRVAARDAARDAAREAAWDAARDAAWEAAWVAARDTAWVAAGAIVLKDKITAEQYGILTKSWRDAGLELA